MVIGCSEQLSLIRFIYQSTPSMRNMEPTAKSKMTARGPKNGGQGVEGILTLGYCFI